MTASFVHLRTHSAYSLLKGAIKIPKLIALAKAELMPAIGLTDHDNLFGSLEFSEYAVKEGIQPILGLTLSLVPFGMGAQAAASTRFEPEHLLVYAKDETGYANLLQLSSQAYTAPALGQTPLIDYATLAKHSAGLIALTGSTQGGFAKSLITNRRADAEKLLDGLQDMFADRLYIELTRHSLPEEKLIERAQIDLALARNIPLVATNNVYFTDAKMYEAHDALLCVADGRYVTESDRPRMNAEHRFKSAKEMKLLFSDIPEALENTLTIAQRCHIWAPSRSPILPGFAMKDESGNVLSESEALCVRARAGLEARLNKLVFTPEMSDAEKEAIAKPYRERLEFELDVIITMKFPGYFLIVSDFISWAKEHDIPVGPGRGSGAGSIVAWVLLITDLDPLRYGLLFERFLNPERVSMPDFDIDFCQDGRERVIHYVREKYGDDKVASIITFGKLQARAVLRDVGRVLQMPYSQVDRICKLVPNNPAAPVTLKEAIDQEPLLKQALDEDENAAHLGEIAIKLEGLYRHASTHAAGVVIGDRPLVDLVPMYRDPKSDMLVVQYSMKWAEAAGLVKFDFLGLRTLSILKKAVDFIAETGVEIDLLKLPEGDKKTYSMLTRGDTLGVFQFESAGMIAALKNLKPDSIEDLIALGALYRPGPMDNIPTYIDVKHGREQPDYLHPLLEPVLKETYGVIIYQEQVQKIAQVLSGYTLGGADLLRRAMGKKIKAEMDAQRAMFVEGAVKNNVNKAQASNIFDLVAKFAGYGFNKSHAAAYAVIAYQTAYLKANYAVEFMAASMTYESGSTDKLSQFVQEAGKFGIEVLPPDINKSQVQFAVEEVGIRDSGFGIREENQSPIPNPQSPKKAVRYALAAIKNVGPAAMAAIIAEREKNGPFKDIHDFAHRVDASVMNRRQMEFLIMAGVFDSLVPNRRQLIESLDMLIASAQNATEERTSSQVSLFGGEAAKEMNRRALKSIEEWPVIEKLNHECSAIGFYLTAHPLEPYMPVFKKLGVSSSTRLSESLPDKQKLKLAGILTATKLRSSPRGRSAFLTLSDAHGQYEVAVFDEHLLNEKHDMLKSGTALLLNVDIRHGERGMRVLVNHIELLDQVAQGVRANLVTVKVEEMAELPRLKEMLGKPLDRGAKVELLVSVPSGVVKLQLAGAYNIAAPEIMQLQSLQGVVAEAA